MLGEEVDAIIQQSYLAGFRQALVDKYDEMVRLREDVLQNGLNNMVSRAVERGETDTVLDFARQIRDYLVDKSGPQQRFIFEGVISAMMSAAAQDIADFDAGGQVRENAERVLRG